MIDKVELRVPAGVPFTKEFAGLYRDLRGRRRYSRPARYYLAVDDLRPFGYQAILHADYVHGSEGHHKVELIDTGRLTYDQMRNEIGRLFEVDPSLLGLMRLDLAADVLDIPVLWFKRHVWVKWKRRTCDIGENYPFQYAQMGKSGVQTLYVGKRPNCYRFYDKLAECRHKYARLKRADSGEALPSFEELFGYPQRGITWTRVERQMGGGRVPTQLETFGKLRNAASFDPFEKLEFTVPGKPAPQPTDYDYLTYLAGLGLRSIVDQNGVHESRQFLNSHYSRHASRIFDRLRDFIPAEDGYQFNSVKLYGLYQESVERQLAAA